MTHILYLAHSQYDCSKGNLRKPHHHFTLQTSYYELDAQLHGITKH